VDEIYADFEHLEDAGRTRSKSARLLAPNVVTTGSLNKAYGLGPERVGWVLGPAEVIARAADVLTVTMGELPVSWMHRCLSALTQMPALEDRARRLIGSKRSRIGQWIKSHENLSWSNPPHGLFGFVTCPRTDRLRESIEAGAQRHRVIVAPGEFFGIADGFRIGWSLPEVSLDAALVRLERVLSDAGVLA
jgi:aspartate/methionine/tyrosine aminotransferase